MIPFSRMVQYGGTPYRNINEIISVIQNQIKDFVLLSSTNPVNLNLSPTNFATSSNNAIQFSTAGYIQFGTSGVPLVYKILDSTDFVIQSNIYLTSTATQLLVGNLNNGSGTGSYWLTLNNVFGSASMISLDGYSTTGAVQRFRFGVGSTKLPINTWVNIKLERIGTNLSFYMNGTQVGASQVMNLGFAGTANNMRIGNSTDNAIPFIGYIDNFRINMGS